MRTKEIVVKGWNTIAREYDRYRDKHKIDGELQQFVDLLPEGARVLDAGSGSGVPASQYLTNAGLKVTGVDLSDTMLEMARENVPDATFLKKDILELDFPNESFEGILSLFTLFHIPRKKHPEVVKRFYELLNKEGILLINTGIRESEGISNFFGMPMFWSNLAPQKTLEAVKKAGFSVLFEGVLQRGGELQYWVLASK